MKLPTLEEEKIIKRLNEAKTKEEKLKIIRERLEKSKKKPKK